MRAEWNQSKNERAGNQDVHCALRSGKIWGHEWIHQHISNKRAVYGPSPCLSKEESYQQSRCFSNGWYAIERRPCFQYKADWLSGVGVPREVRYATSKRICKKRKGQTHISQWNKLQLSTGSVRLRLHLGYFCVSRRFEWIQQLKNYDQATQTLGRKKRRVRYQVSTQI